MRSYRAQHNQMAVSANNRETSINTFQNADTLMLVSLTDVINVEPRRESNENELSGKEEADEIFDLGTLSEGILNFEKAQPQHFAFILSYALGKIATIAAGTGYEHEITPLEGDVDVNRSLPSFTLVQRLGNQVAKRRFASMFIDQATCTFARDSWCKAKARVRGTGLYTDNVYEKSYTRADNITELVLDSGETIHGSTSEERLDNVQRIRMESSPGVWEEIEYSAVDASTPSAITITNPGGAGDNKTYKILAVYSEPAWCTFPAKVEETPLRVSECTFHLGGKWNGTSFSGGLQICSEVKSIEYTIKNDLEITFSPCQSGDYAGRSFRAARIQTLRLDREMRNFILQSQIKTNEYIGVRIFAEGAEYESGHNYQVEIIFPRVGLLTAPIMIDGKVLAEAGDFKILQDTAYGSVIVKIKNLQATYAA